MAPVLAMLPPHSPNSFWAPCGTRKPPATIRTAGQASHDTLSYRPCNAGIRKVTAVSVSVVETMCASPPPCRRFAPRRSRKTFLILAISRALRTYDDPIIPAMRVRSALALLLIALLVAGCARSDARRAALCQRVVAALEDGATPIGAQA